MEVRNSLTAQKSIHDEIYITLSDEELKKKRTEERRQRLAEAKAAAEAEEADLASKARVPVPVGPHIDPAMTDLLKNAIMGAINELGDSDSENGDQVKVDIPLSSTADPITEHRF